MEATSTVVRQPNDGDRENAYHEYVSRAAPRPVEARFFALDAPDVDAPGRGPYQAGRNWGSEREGRLLRPGVQSPGHNGGSRTSSRWDARMARECLDRRPFHAEWRA